MNQKVFILIFSFISTICLGQGIEFYDGKWEDALIKAEKEGKMMFVDAYASWCGPCKKMAATVFKDQKVGEFFNKNFINVKIDMEKDQGPSFGSKYPVSAYPTLLYIDGSGELIHRQVGGQKADTFVKTAQQAIKKNDRSGDYAEKYDAGDRDYDLVLNYVKALNTAEKSSLKISNEYLRSKPEITPEQKAIFLFEAVTEADSRLFDMLMKDLAIVKKIKTDDEILDKIKSACDRTVFKAVKYETPELLDEAQSKLKKAFPKESKSYNILSDMTYFEEMHDMDKYAKKCEECYKKLIKDNAEELSVFSTKLATKYKKNKQLLGIAEKASARAVKLEKSVPYLVSYAKILSLNNKNDKALAVTDQAIELAKEAGEPTHQLEGMKKYFNSK